MPYILPVTNEASPRYRVRLFGVLGDSWTDPRRFASREEARKVARFLMTDPWVGRFDRSVRAAFVSVRVEAV